MDSVCKLHGDITKYWTCAFSKGLVCMGERNSKRAREREGGGELESTC